MRTVRPQGLYWVQGSLARHITLPEWQSSNSIFDDVPVEDAFVYKAARGVRPSKSPPSLKPTQKSKLRHIAKIH